MKSKLTDSQVLFCIFFTLLKNSEIYTLFERKKLIGKPSQKLILKNINYLKSPIANSEDYNSNYRFDSIIKLINYCLFMSFSNTFQNYELSILKDFRHYKKGLKPNNFNDFNFILDFWYSYNAEIFKNEIEYKSIILKAIENSSDTSTWINRSPSGAYFKNSVKINYRFEHKNLGDISAFILNYIEEKLGKPEWLKNPHDIIERLRLTKSYPEWLIDISEYIFNETTSEPENIFLSEITDNKLIQKYLERDSLF